MAQKIPKCKICRGPAVIGGVVPICSPKCAIELARRTRDKKEAKERAKKAAKTREKKDKAKTRGQLLKEAQVEFNRFVRARDHDKPCVSCGRHHQGQYHSGHYLTTKARPDLRFCEDNAHKQCSVCNNHLSGNIINYRLSLVEIIGADRVTELELGPRGRSDWSIDELREIKKRYRKRAKELA